MTYSGRKVIVTGGAGGLGTELCRQLMQQGADVAIIGRDRAKAESLVSQYGKPGQVFTFVAADFEDAELAGTAVDEATDRLGGVDVLFNNAALALRRGVSEASPADWSRMMSVNVAAPYFAACAASEHMKAESVIVNVASEMGRIANGESILYATSKAALIHLSDCLAVAFASQGIRVIAVAPGPFRTPMLEESIRQSGQDIETGLATYAARVPLGRLATAEEVAQTMLFVASSKAAYMTGGVVGLDGGTTLNRS